MSNPSPPAARSAVTAADFDDLLVGGATVLLAIAGSWLAVVVLAGAAESLSGGRVRALSVVGCPRTWRPVVLLLVGAALTLSTSVAHAGQPRADAGGDRHWLPLPTRPVDLPARRFDPQVVVRPHDTLWGIARTQLAVTADDGSVMTYAARLHRANRVLIGEDPDLIHPGQRLELPAAPREGARR